MEAVTTRVSENIRLELDQRFTNFERIFERMAPPAPAPEPINTQAEKQPAEAPTPTQPQTRSTRSVTGQEGDAINHHSLSSFQDPSLASRQLPARTPTATITREAPGLAASRPEVQPPTNVNNNNNNATWSAWLAMQQPFSSQRSALPGLMPGPSHHMDGSLEDQERYIMETTPHQLAGNVPSGGYRFPYKYVTRGPEKRRLNFNTVTLAEHFWGMFRMLDDQCTDPAIKPALLSHMKEVAEDACEYEWNTHVCRWSEEVFSMVAENRLPDGWKSVSRIQNLRTGMSRVDGARLSAPKDTSQKRFSAQPHVSDNLKGGPPCPGFNSSQGCTLQSGHLSNGVKQLHICSYCLANTAATHPHPESRCRTKQRHAAAHF